MHLGHNSAIGDNSHVQVTIIMIVSDSMVLSRTRFVCYHFVECFNGYAGGIHDSECVDGSA